VGVEELTGNEKPTPHDVLGFCQDVCRLESIRFPLTYLGGVRFLVSLADAPRRTRLVCQVI